MNPSDYAFLSAGTVATFSAATINHLAAAFCALAVGTCAILNYLDKRKKDRKEAARDAD